MGTLKGKLHRVNGPAIEYDDGSKYWYLNGKELTEEEFNRTIKFSSINIRKLI